MKKLSLILAGALLLGGISFASPVVKQQPAKATTTKTDKSKTSSKKVVKKADSKKTAPAAKPAAK